MTAVKGFTKEGLHYANGAGIPGMLVSGYLRTVYSRPPCSSYTICFMLFVILAIPVYWFNPAGNILIDNLALDRYGPIIYGPVMMIGQAADMVPRVATGGYWSYRPSDFTSSVLLVLVPMGLMVDLYGWDGGLHSWCMYLAIVFLLLTR